MQRSINHLQYTVEIAIHIHVGDPNHEKTERLEGARSFLISFQRRRRRVCDAIDLDNELSVECDEIHDVSV